MAARRLFPVLLATALLAAAAPNRAHAQAWQEYSYPDQGVAFQLPAVPTVKDETAATPTGVKAPVKTWRAEGKGIVYTLQIYDLSKTQVNAATLIADTEKALIGAGKVDVAVDSRINRRFGRELTVNAADGSRLTLALFYFDQHLYQLTAKALPPDPADRSAQAIHFQQSLQFVGLNGQGFGGGFGGGGPGPDGQGGGFRGRGRFGPGGGGPGGPAAQAACAGKAAGDKVTFQTPDGQQTQATCVLVARPDRPPGGGPPP
jgi:hypothetical protein